MRGTWWQWCIFKHTVFLDGTPCNVVRSLPVFQINIQPPSSGRESKPSKRWARLTLFVAYLSYSLTLKMEAVCSSETSVNFYNVTFFSHLTFNLNDLKSVISVLNFPSLWFSSVKCSNPLLDRETLNWALTVHVHIFLSYKISWWHIRSTVCLPPAFTHVSCSAYSSTLKMEAVCSSETSVDVGQTTRSYIPEDSTLDLTLSL
jgi:hypothetical protein